MDEISKQQIYGLAREVLRGVDRLESRIDEVLLEARLLGQEIHRTRQEFAQHSLKVSLS